MSPLLFDSGWTIATRIVALTPSMNRLLRLKIWRISVKGRCHGNQFCGARRRQVGIPRRYCLCWYFKTVGKIAKRLPTKILHSEPSTSFKNFLNFGPVTPEILWPAKGFNCDVSRKGRCYGNRFVARVSEN